MHRIKEIIKAVSIPKSTPLTSSEEIQNTDIFGVFEFGSDPEDINTNADLIEQLYKEKDELKSLLLEAKQLYKTTITTENENMLEQIKNSDFSNFHVKYTEEGEK